MIFLFLFSNLKGRGVEENYEDEAETGKSLRRLERVFSHGRSRSLHTTPLECMRQLSESKFLLTSRARKTPEVKCRVKSRKPKIKLARNICLYLEILLGDVP